GGAVFTGMHQISVSPPPLPPIASMCVGRHYGVWQGTLLEWASWPKSHCICRHLRVYAIVYCMLWDKGPPLRVSVPVEGRPTHALTVGGTPSRWGPTFKLVRDSRCAVLQLV